MLSCHRRSVSEGFIPSRLVITGGKVGSVILVTVFDSASSMSGTSTWSNTMFVDRFSLCNDCIFSFSIFSGDWKNSGIIFTKFSFL